MCILEVVPLYTLTPQFSLSIRVLYARDVQGRRGEGIDKGFSLSECSPSCDTRGTMIVFADVELNDEMDGIKGVSSEDGEVQPV